MSLFKKGGIFGNWVLDEYIDEGGNGEVWQACAKDDLTNTIAIKILKKTNSTSYARFKAEITVLKNNNDVQGLLQLVDYDLPGNVKGRHPWYSMPLAMPLKYYIGEKSPEEKIEMMLFVSRTLQVLHDRGISHRDIKPGNILVVDDVVCLSDFGLVDYPDKEEVTLRWKDVGARWTIAPEMRRNPDTSDGKPADIYSLAKTLWIILLTSA